MPFRASRTVFAAGMLVAFIIVGCSSAAKPSRERQDAPDFALKDADGKTVRLSDYRGKVVLLNFWATWCGPCRIEIPWLIDFERQYKDRGFAVIGVSMDDEGWDAVKPFVGDLAINYRIILGNDEVAGKYGGVEALPTSFIIDRDGKVADVHQGLVSKSKFQNGIEKLLQASPARQSRVGGADLARAAAGSN